MANPNAPYGIKPVRYLTGGTYQDEVNEYTIATGNTTAIFRGDLVKATAGGDVERSAAGDLDNLGVFMGCSYEDSNGEVQFRNYWTGETGASNIKARVMDNPNVICRIRGDATAFAKTNIHQNANFDPGTGSTRTGLSGGNLDGGSLATGSAGLRILRLVDDGENEFGAYAEFEVLINEHGYKITAGT